MKSRPDPRAQVARSRPAAAPVAGNPSYAAELAAGVQRLGLALGAVAQDRALAYLDLMSRWNRVYNLTALRDPRQMLTHHLLDSLAALPPVQARASGRPLRVLDVGSGGGLPGVAWALAEPDWSVVCLDAVEKKAAFVAQVAGELRLSNLRAVHARVEDWQASVGFDVITSRAFASLKDFTELTRHLRAPDGVWLALKGQRPDEEMNQLPEDVEVFHVEPLQVPGLEAERCLVWMRPRGTAPRSVGASGAVT